MQRLAEIGFGVTLRDREAIRSAVDVQEWRVIYVGLFQLNSARSRGSAARGAFAIGDHRAKGLLNTRYIGDRIQQDLRVKWARERVGIVDQVFLVCGVGPAG